MPHVPTFHFRGPTQLRLNIVNKFNWSLKKRMSCEKNVIIANDRHCTLMSHGLAYL